MGWSPTRSGAGSQGQGPDVTALFAAVIAVPLILPVVVKLSSLAFAVPAAVFAAMVARCLTAARATRGRTAFWRTLAVGGALSCAASVLTLVALVASGVADAGFYLGAASSVALLAACAEYARRNLRHASLALLADGLLVVAVVAAVGIWFVLLPGFSYGDGLLTYVFLVDLTALAIALVGTVARRDARHRAIGWMLTAGCAAAAAGDGLVSANAAHQLSVAPSWIAGLWALGGLAIIAAVDGELAPTPSIREPSEGGRAWLWARVLLPLGVVASFPAIAFALWLAGKLDAASTSFFAIFFVAVLILAFGRQAYLIVDNRRAVSRERALRSEAVVRNEELEALTELATTMTETLDEDQIVERGLNALRLGAGAESAALHLDDGGVAALRATVGEWPTDRSWVRDVLIPEEPTRELRGGREILQFPASARGRRLGVVTLVRRAARSDGDRKLIELLSGQLAVAIQNARDYHDSVEQSLRDPLTGLHNRRYLHDVLEKEVHRNTRYGNPVSVVLFDVDDFKAVNDTHGHKVGDDVLRALARIVETRIRPVDTFARMGGEEFALLLPETTQLDALAVADRLRRAVAAQEIVPSWPVTLSGGVASAPEDAQNADEILNKADGALYWAKHNGKNMCAVASEVVISDESTPERTVVGHLYALAASVDRDQLGTPEHSGNVAAYAVAIGGELGLPAGHLVKLRRAAMLHDVGKVTVSASILRKPGPLDRHEIAAMRKHPELGATMLLHSGLADEARWVRHHHERMDGAGYPDQLADDEIPIESRILFVADAYEAMTAARHYSAAMDSADAVAELRRCAGAQFDPRVVEAFARVLEREELPAPSAAHDPAPQQTTA